MPSSATNPRPLFDTIIDALRHGPRTTTYKLATMMALLDFSCANRLTRTDATLKVPIPDLARIVIDLYWQQTRQFEGRNLRQSRLPRSRILDAVTELQAAAGGHEALLTPDEAASAAPQVFRRTADDVGIYLARQPLPRLQRSPGNAKSITFMYDDSFLHDNVTQSELARHNNAIQLLPGVASKLVAAEVRLRSALRVMWTYDVMSINGISRDRAEKLATHLFGTSVSKTGAQKEISVRSMRGSSAPAKNSDPLDQKAISSIATRLNHLFEIHRAPDGQPFSSGEVAAKIRKLGFPISVSTVSQLRAGTGPPPSIGALRALAAFFDVRPSYLAAEDRARTVGSIKPTSASEPRSPASDARLDSNTESRQLSDDGSDNPLVASASSANNASVSYPRTAEVVEPKDWDATKDDAWGLVAGPRLDDVKAACLVRGNGCWLAPTGKSVRCRAENDRRSPLDLPKIALHRWAWMISKGLTDTPIPSHLIQIRRRCSADTCCNPEHLYATQPGGGPLTEDQLALLFGTTAIRASGTPGLSRESASSDTGRVVLPDNISAIASHCKVEKTGCWIAPTAAPIACRADGDERDAKDLPQLAYHRWAWMVVHGFASNPLPGNKFQVRRFCGKTTCCKPDHLYLAGLDGRELPISEADAWFRSREAAASRAETKGGWATGWSVDPAPRLPAIERAEHEKTPAFSRADHPRLTPGNATPAPSTRLFAERLNRLFENRSETDGNTYTSAEAAAHLQEDGLAISASLIDRLRAATGDLPTPQTTEALSYLFNVDVDYFLVAVAPETADEGTAADGQDRQIGFASTDPRVQVIPMTAADIGGTISMLSEVTSDCIADSSRDTQRLGRLLDMISEIGALLATPRESFIISRLLLTRIVTELTSAGRKSNSHEAHVSRLQALLNEA